MKIVIEFEPGELREAIRRVLNELDSEVIQGSGGENAPDDDLRIEEQVISIVRPAAAE